MRLYWIIRVCLNLFRDLTGWNETLAAARWWQSHLTFIDPTITLYSTVSYVWNVIVEISLFGFYDLWFSILLNFGKVNVTIIVQLCNIYLFISTSGFFLYAISMLCNIAHFLLTHLIYFDLFVSLSVDWLCDQLDTWIFPRGWMKYLSIYLWATL